MKTNLNLIEAKIIDIVDATPKIKIFRLEHNESHYQFKPGQWIDLYAPIEGKNIGGYTLISTPDTKNIIELAIRESSHHPVTKYMHEEAKINSRVYITEGQGRFTLDEEMSERELIFIAGGIGITPLLSMMRWLKNKKRDYQLFYSVSFESDFLLRSELLGYAHLFVTKDKNFKGSKQRMTMQDLKKTIQDLKRADYFICGPREMIDNFVTELEVCGVDKKQIHYEKWW